MSQRRAFSPRLGLALALLVIFAFTAGGYWLLPRAPVVERTRPVPPTPGTPPMASKPETAPTPSEPPVIEPVSTPAPAVTVGRLSLPQQLQTRPATVLQACWTAEQLRGSPQEKQIQKQTMDRSPPARLRYQVSPLSASLHQCIRSVKPRHGEKLVALTFDLCEQAHERSGYDAAIVNYLRDQQVKATFFAGGKWMRSHPERTMQLMADPLFELGNHAWTHGNLRLLQGPAMMAQITWTQAEYERLREQLLQAACVAPWATTASAAIPARLTVFRFPYGVCNAESLAAVNRLGLAAIQWNIVTGDPAPGQTAHAIARTILGQIQPGSIVVAHANGRGWHTAAALPLLVPALRARGYRFVTVSELLAQGEVVAVDSCYELKPGDNLKYDRRRTAQAKK